MQLTCMEHTCESHVIECESHESMCSLLRIRLGKLRPNKCKIMASKKVSCQTKLFNYNNMLFITIETTMAGDVKC